MHEVERELLAKVPAAHFVQMVDFDNGLYAPCAQCWHEELPGLAKMNVIAI